MATTHLLYLHGFRSSPQSAKARQMAARVAADHPGVTWWCPQLPPSPAEAAALIERGTADWPAERKGFVKVMPRDFKRVLAAVAEAGIDTIPRGEYQTVGAELRKNMLWGDDVDPDTASN